MTAAGMTTATGWRRGGGGWPRSRGRLRGKDTERFFRPGTSAGRADWLIAFLADSAENLVCLETVKAGVFNQWHVFLHSSSSLNGFYLFNSVI